LFDCPQHFQRHPLSFCETCHVRDVHCFIRFKLAQNIHFVVPRSFINGGARVEAEAFLRIQWPTGRRMPNPKRKGGRRDTLYYRCDACVLALDRTGATAITAWPWTYSR
jgi:hypothetical protein